MTYFILASYKNSKGLSLVELLVALAVSSLLLLGVTSMYLSSRQTDSLGNELAKIQETGRHAIDFMAKDIRMIGYQGCMDPETLTVNVIAQNPPTANIFQTAIRGFEVTNSTWANGTEFDNTAIESRAAIGSDVIAIQRASTEDVELTGNLSSSNANIQINGNPMGFQKEDIVIIADCETADMFRITNAPGTSGTVTLTHSIGTTNTTNRLGAAYNTDARIMSFESIVYFVADTGRFSEQGLPVSALFRQTDQMTNAGASTFLIEELIEGVENMQILYGERVASGNIRYVTADNISDSTEVEGIKLGLLVASNSEVIPSNDQITYSLPGEDIAPLGTAGATVTHAADRRLRRVFTSSINIRNRRDN